MNNKKGAVTESTTIHAATVILVIGLLIVLYLVLIPPDVREDILEGKEIDFDSVDKVDKDDKDERDKVLLLKNPGTLLPSGLEIIEEDFASLNLFDTSRLESKKLAERVVVSRSIFSNDFVDLEFVLDDLRNLERLELFLNIKKSEGILEILLNGETVFEGTLESGDIPLELPLVNVRERNRLKIMAGSVGWAFLSMNEFELRDLELIKEIRSENRVESRTFDVNRADAVDDAILKFFVNCLEIEREQGILKVFLNRGLVFFGMIVCDASQSHVDVSEDLFVDGINTLTFEIDKGNYIIEKIGLDYRFDQAFHPEYFFTITEDDFEDILDGDTVLLIMRFDNDISRKRADIRINDKTIFLDVHTGQFEKDITELTREGENFIKIFAKQEFDLVQLEIILKRD